MDVVNLEAKTKLTVFDVSDDRMQLTQADLKTNTFPLPNCFVFRDPRKKGKM